MINKIMSEVRSVNNSLCGINIFNRKGQNKLTLGLMFIFVYDSTEFVKSVLISKVIYH